MTSGGMSEMAGLEDDVSESQQSGTAICVINDSFESDSMLQGANEEGQEQGRGSEDSLAAYSMATISLPQATEKQRGEEP